MKWHNPGLGKVHNEYHSQMIYCENVDGIVDDVLAKEVCDMLNSKVQPAVEPVAWREQFASQVYADLAAADNQDVPLEQYPARILKVLDSIVGPRHPTVVQWRNDAIRNCASIAYKYCRDPESANFLKQDLEALLTATPAPAPNALDAETAIKNCLEAGETMRVLKRVVNLLLESRRNLGPEDHELRDRIDQLFRPDAAIAAQSAQGKEGHR